MDYIPVIMYVLAHPLLLLAVVIAGGVASLFYFADFKKKLDDHTTKDDALAARVSNLEGKLDIIIELLKK